MTVLDIEGRKVNVDDSFMNLSPEEQQATVNDIGRQLGPAPAPNPEQALNMDIARGALQGVRNVAEAPFAVGEPIMFGAKIGNLVARNFPQLGLKEVPEEVLRQYIPFSSGEIADVTTRAAEALGVPPEIAKPYEPTTAGGKAAETGITMAPLALAGARTLETAFPKTFGPSPAAPAAPKGTTAFPTDPESAVAAAQRMRNEAEAVKRGRYAYADQQAGPYTPQQYGYLVNKVQQAADVNQLSPDRAPKAFSILNDLKGRMPQPPSADQIASARLGGQPLPQMGTPPGSLDTEALRGQLSALLRGPDKAERMAAGKMLDAWDKALPIIDASSPYRQAARAANVVFEQQNVITDAFERAQRAANTSGKDFGLALRDQFKRMADNPRTMRQFDNAGKAFVNTVVNGGPWEQTMMKLSRSPLTSRLAGSIFGFVHGGPFGMLGGASTSDAVRAFLQNQAGRGTLSRAQELQQIIQGGLKTRPLEMSLTTPRGPGSAAATGWWRNLGISDEQAAELLKEAAAQTDEQLVTP